MLSQALKLIFAVFILLGLAYALTTQQIALERQENNWRAANHRINKLEHPELIRVFYNWKK